MQFVEYAPNTSAKHLYIELFLKRDHPFVPMTGEEHLLTRNKGVIQLIPGTYYLVGNVENREEELLEMKISRKLFETVGRERLVLKSVRRKTTCPNPDFMRDRSTGLNAFPDLLDAAFKLGYWAQLCDRLGKSGGRTDALELFNGLKRRLEDYGVKVRLRNSGEQ